MSNIEALSGESSRRHEVTFHIRIDRQEYEVHKEVMTGLELRHVPHPPIGPDRDLFEVVPGGSDRKISDEEDVRIQGSLDDLFKIVR